MTKTDFLIELYSPLLKKCESVDRLSEIKRDFYSQKDNYGETTLDKAWSRLMDRDLRRYVNLKRVRKC